MRKSIWVSLIVILGIIVAAMFVCVIPPRSQTLGAMNMCKRRVLRYAAEHGKLPSSLPKTQAIWGYDSSIKDGWGVLLDYRTDKNGVVRIVSLGKDRKPGGGGDNMDMIGTFPSRQPDGSWSEEFVDWTQDPFESLTREKLNQ